MGREQFCEPIQDASERLEVIASLPQLIHLQGWQSPHRSDLGSFQDICTCFRDVGGPLSEPSHDCSGNHGMVAKLPSRFEVALYGKSQGTFNP
jgi:hypothetical protein